MPYSGNKMLSTASSSGRCHGILKGLLSSLPQYLPQEQLERAFTVSSFLILRNIEAGVGKAENVNRDLGRSEQNTNTANKA